MFCIFKETTERYRIKLTKEEVENLQEIIKKGSHSTQTFRSAYVLLNCDEGEYADKVNTETDLLICTGKVNI